MPARSRAQQKAAGAALAAKRDPAKAKDLWGAAREMYETLSERQLEEFAETPLDNIPEHVKSRDGR